MDVRSILADKGSAVTTVLPGDAIAVVIATLDEHKIGAVVVSDGQGGVTGILSERDIVKWIARNGPGVLDQAVSTLMTKEVVGCRLDDGIDDVMAVMTRGKFRHMPVAEDGKLAGIVSIGDVVKHKLAAAEFEAQAMRDYIATG